MYHPVGASARLPLLRGAVPVLATQRGVFSRSSQGQDPVGHRTGERNDTHPQSGASISRPCPKTQKDNIITYTCIQIPRYQMYCRVHAHMYKQHLKKKPVHVSKVLHYI